MTRKYNQTKSKNRSTGENVLKINFVNLTDFSGRWFSWKRLKLTENTNNASNERQPVENRLGTRNMHSVGHDNYVKMPWTRITAEKWRKRIPKSEPNDSFAYRIFLSGEKRIRATFLSNNEGIFGLKIWTYMRDMYFSRSKRHQRSQKFPKPWSLFSPSNSDSRWNDFEEKSFNASTYSIFCYLQRTDTVTPPPCVTCSKCINQIPEWQLLD